MFWFFVVWGCVVYLGGGCFVIALMDAWFLASDRIQNATIPRNFRESLRLPAFLLVIFWPVIVVMVIVIATLSLLELGFAKTVDRLTKDIESFLRDVRKIFNSDR